MKRSKEEYAEIDLLLLGAALWHRAWAIVLAMLVCGGAAFGWSCFLVKPLYESTALMYVNNSSFSVGSTSISLSDLNASKTLVDTYIVIMRTRSTLNEVIERTGVDYTYEELRKIIKASAVNETEIFGITVTSYDPAEAELLANTIADVLPGKIAEIMDGSSARLVDFAVAATEKSSPSITKYTALGLMLGLLLSSGAIIFLELTDEHIRDVDYLTQTYGLPLLAEIPDLMARKAGKGYYTYESSYEARKGRD